MEYDTFLDAKRIQSTSVGFDIADSMIHPALFPFQRSIVTWALRRGRSAIFATTGLGKTIQQLEWARHVHLRTGENVLILAPLAVSQQTVREGEKIGLNVTICREQSDATPGVNITNYERLHKFEPSYFGGIVLDESSILKGFNSTTRKDIGAFIADIHYRLACTATPAPNDLIEITNHAEFLGVMSGKEIIALYFTQDGNTTHKWRLKGHARRDFWKWMASWCVAVRYPSDLGFDDGDFRLPSLRMHQHNVGGMVTTGMLFPVEAQTLQERQKARRDSIVERVGLAAQMVNASTEPWIVWCDLNGESEALARSIPDAVEVTGSDSIEVKEERLRGFSEGAYRVIVTKLSIAGFGLNWQHCAHMAFVGLSDSWEQQFQAIRRCWRFGQQREVNVHVISAETEGAVVRNIERKDKQAAEMMNEVVKHMQIEHDIVSSQREEMDYREDVATGHDWTLYLRLCQAVATDRE